jgi:hypothetical protein
MEASGIRLVYNSFPSKEKNRSLGFSFNTLLCFVAFLIMLSGFSHSSIVSYVQSILNNCFVD